MPDEATWLEIERAYRETSESVVSIAQRTGVPRSTINARIKGNGWVRLAHSYRWRIARDAVAQEGSLAAARDEVARQLYRRMSERLRKLELEAERRGMPPAADDPDDRMLTNLIRQFEKLTGLDGIAKRERGRGGTRDRSCDDRAKPGSRDQQQSPPLDAVRIRNEIADRLEKLHAERKREGGSS